MRIRGQIVLNLSVVTAIGDGFDAVAVGICNVSENAFDAGVASVPTPLADLAWDGWIYHQLVGRMFGPETAELGASVLDSVRMDIDSKAMRKTRFSDVLIGVVEVGTETGTATLLFSGITRILDKLP